MRHQLRVIRLCWLAFRSYFFPLPLRLRVARSSGVTTATYLNDCRVPNDLMRGFYLELALKAMERGVDWMARGRPIEIEIVVTSTKATFVYLSEAGAPRSKLHILE